MLTLPSPLPVACRRCLVPIIQKTPPAFDICLDTYRRVVAQQAGAVDLFLCETMSSIKEVKAAVQAAVESGKPVWCGMSVMDEDGTRLRSGEALDKAALAAKQAGAAAVLINCSSAGSGYSGDAGPRSNRPALRGICQWFYPH